MTNKERSLLLSEAHILLDDIEETIENMFSAAIKSNQAQ